MLLCLRFPTRKFGNDLHPLRNLKEIPPKQINGNRRRPLAFTLFQDVCTVSLRNAPRVMQPQTVGEQTGGTETGTKEEAGRRYSICVMPTGMELVL